jgi:hypothetical protein
MFIAPSRIGRKEAPDKFQRWNEDVSKVCDSDIEPVNMEEGL